MQDIAAAFFGFVMGAFQNPDALPGWILFGALIVWFLFSAVLVYHWFKYNLGSAFTPVALFVYIFGSFILIGYTASAL